MFDTGVGIKNPLWFIGVVENCIDPRNEGRVQVRAFGAHGSNQDIPTEDLPWAICIKGDYSPNGFMVPDVNDFVFGFFIDGRDAQQPMILGLVPTQMTEEIDPERTGWGTKLGTNSTHEDRLAARTKGENFGQPQQDRLARGENVEETYVLEQASATIEEIKVAEGGPTWKEPQPAYAAQYPFNKIIKTSSHVIELDDTPDHERIMIWHKKGSFIQIDSNGGVVNKASGDSFDVKEKGQHVYIGGRNVVTIMGHSHIYYDGNVTEEVNGDYTQIIHGNHYVGVGGQASINATEQLNLRAADVLVEAYRGMFAGKAKEEIKFEAEKSIHVKSKYARFQATEDLFIKSNNAYFETVADFHQKCDNLYVEGLTSSHLRGGLIQIQATDGDVGIDGDTVNIDDYVSMAEGNAGSATAADGSEDAESAPKPELPEPPAKSTSTTADKRSRDAGDAGGITSQDDGVDV